jgi:hypothetical protein
MNSAADVRFQVGARLSRWLSIAKSVDAAKAGAMQHGT